MSDKFVCEQELNDLILRHARKPGEPFRPLAYYNPEGDSIEFIFSEEEYTAERIDSFVTVYVGDESGDLVGSVLKDVTLKLRELRYEHPEVEVQISDGRVRLECLLKPEKGDLSNPSKRFIYRRLQKVAQQNDAVAELAYSQR